ncbi:hypothetical protein [Sanguibacter suarezii]|nr:hypothetical protein [Sanguibacter suarezii]
MTTTVAKPPLSPRWLERRPGAGTRASTAVVPLGLDLRRPNRA